jgi:surface polysaccharide O-acyltransferase-like enzyme
MLSGALILPKKDTLKNFFKKRFSRILFPFLFWSVIYFIFNIIEYNDEISKYTTAEWHDYLINQITMGTSFHLWYVYALIGIYMTFPILSKWIVNSSKKEVWYFAFIWAIEIIYNLTWADTYKTDIDLCFFTGYLGYPVLGYLLSSRFTFKLIKPVSLGLFLTGTLITIIATDYCTKANGTFCEDYYSYTSINVIIAAIGFFIFFSQSSFKLTALRPIIDFISKYSFGIYLSHVLVLFYLSEIGISYELINPIIGIPLTTIICLIISLLLTLGISKIPGGKYISG